MPPTPPPTIVQGLEAFGRLADYMTVNVSSPNTPGLRALQQRDALAGLLAALAPARGSIPLFLKVAPDLGRRRNGHRGTLPEPIGSTALIVGNTTISRPSTCARRGAESGGLSGRPLFARSTRSAGTNVLRLGGRVPLIGVGGIATGADAYAKIRAGATAVQLYTAMIYQGPGVVARILTELDAFAARDGIAGSTTPSVPMRRFLAAARMTRTAA